jgi:hypothetical protein
MTMKKFLIGAALAAGLCSAYAQTTPPEVARHQAQELRHGDPARWYKPDRGAKAELATLRKENQAALAEALQGCKQAGAGARSDCVREARATYNADMANIREQRLAAKEMQKTYETSGR